MAYVRITAVLAFAVIVLAGCGSRDLDVNYDNPGTYDAVKFANTAMNFAREEGKSAALREFSAPSTPFKNGRLYIFAVDFDGKILAHPYRPDLVGKNIRDVLGSAVADEMLKRASLGCGWLQRKYKWVDPLTGLEELKEAYVVNVNNNWFVGTGVYPDAAPVTSDR